MEENDQTTILDLNLPTAELRQLFHDLRTPLSVLSMSLQVVGKLRNDDEQFTMITEMMQSAVVELTDKINAMAKQALANSR